jgi:hypothetical protein
VQEAELGLNHSREKSRLNDMLAEISVAEHETGRPAELPCESASSKGRDNFIAVRRWAWANGAPKQVGLLKNLIQECRDFWRDEPSFRNLPLKRTEFTTDFPGGKGVEKVESGRSVTSITAPLNTVTSRKGWLLSTSFPSAMDTNRSNKPIKAWCRREDLYWHPLHGLPAWATAFRATGTSYNGAIYQPGTGYQWLGRFAGRNAADGDDFSL